MKTPQPGDIVTPKENCILFKKSNQYQVLATFEKDKSIILVNDSGVRQMVSYKDFHNITHVPIFERICNFVNKIIGYEKH